MKQCIKLATIIALCGISKVISAEEKTPAFIQEAREATMTFQKALKKELMSAMQSGGPKKAVEVCHSRAPEIAEEISRKTGWEIGRTALKTPNDQFYPHDMTTGFEVGDSRGAFTLNKYLES